LIPSGFKPEIKGLYLRTSVLRGQHYLLESRARHASRTSHLPPILEIRPNRLAFLYSNPHMTTDLTKHQGLSLALLRSFSMQRIRIGAIHVPSCLPSVIFSSTYPPQCCVRDLLTVAVVARMSRNIKNPSNAVIQGAPAAFGTTKTSHDTLTPNIRQRESGIAHTRLASIQEGRLRCSREKTTLTEMLEPCTEKRASCNSLLIPIPVADHSQWSGHTIM
jgi:hypothetical protein